MLNSPISYSIYNLFTPEECDEIIQLGMQGRYDPGNIGDHSEHDVDKNIRDTELYFFNDQKIWSKIQPVIDAANRDNGWNFELAHSENFQLTVYNKAEGLNKGSILIFPSYTAHKVNAVTKGQRYSLVCWICGYPWR
jgi:predicted 2-oxoglutarate/Fe(II)-dependent dioxygenase YbiX